MMRRNYIRLSVFRDKNTGILLFLTLLAWGCSRPSSNPDESAKQEAVFPDELVHFVSGDKNPVFTGTGTDTWDEKIRERGYILHEDDGYHLWYTGYREQGEDTVMHLGYATSPDGLVWTRYGSNPIFTESWTEDMMVLKQDSLYYMFAEGKNDVAHMLTSSDKIHWKDHGSLQIRQTNGQPLTPGPFGTPVAIKEDSTWYLFYERNDEAIWLASSKDLRVWTNVQDEPVLNKGPEAYDKFGVAFNQVIKYNGLYYAYYHGTAFEDWREWSTNAAVSKDLIHWEKYSGNPLQGDNKSSGILVNDGTQYRLYTMHDQVVVHFPAGTAKQ